MFLIVIDDKSGYSSQCKEENLLGQILNFEFNILGKTQVKSEMNFL